MQAEKEGIKKKEEKSSEGWFSRLFGSKKAAAEAQNIGRLHCSCENSTLFVSEILW